MNISIKVIPNDQQRYDTVGDWWFDDAGNLKIRVSALSNWKYESLVALHEMIEAFLCKDRGISEEEVTRFDKAFEKKRKKRTDDEPGDDPAAPYRREHLFAENIEFLTMDAFGIAKHEYSPAGRRRNWSTTTSATTARGTAG